MTVRPCASCGAPFASNNPNRRLCRKGCGRTNSHASRSRARATRDLVFTGVDGEGVTRANGEHDYVLLSVGDESLTCATGEPRLRWWEIFEFLDNYSTAHPDEVLVGFFLDYDWTHWLRTFPEERARMLLTDAGREKRQRRIPHLPPFPLSIRDPRGWEWECDILPRRRFKVRRAGEKRWTWICDTGSFWQSSFLKAIDPSAWPHPICTDDEYRIILEGKEQRSTAVFDRSMIRYNVTENRVLSNLTRELNRAFIACGVRLQRQQFMGPGQAASKWIELQGCPRRDEVYGVVPEYAIGAGWACYYGGWFEQFAHGHVGDCHEYDINSAYPHVISQLPCLVHGQWNRGTGQPPSTRWVMVHAAVIGSDPHVGAMLHRDPHGRILRPHVTGGWYWQHEIDAAHRAGLIDHVEYAEWIEYRACDCRPPLQGIKGLYQQRLKVGKNTPEGRALKLIYNSMYGKMAQSVGQPQWANPIWASLITAGCRTMILDAIATHPEGTRAVVMTATDGVYFTSPHPTLPLSGDTLGLWDTAVKHNLTLFQPGVYWDDKTRERIGAGVALPPMKSRGVPARYLAPEIARLDDEFARFDGDPERWPEATIPIPFAMVSAKQALARGKWETAGRVHTDTHSTLCAPDCTQGTRVVRSIPIEKRDIREITREDFIRTGVYHWATWRDDAPSFAESARYEPKNGEDYEITPDGDIWSEIQETLHG